MFLNTADFTSVNPGSATATFRLYNDGRQSKATTGGESFFQDWLTPGTNAALYEVKATEISGTVSTGTVGSYIDLGTTRSWSRSAGSTDQIVTLKFDLRRVGSSVILITSTFSIEADGTP